MTTHPTDAASPLSDMQKALLDAYENGARLRRELDEAAETWTDDKGVTWRPPTAWAYAQLCRVRDELIADRDQWKARAEAAEANQRTPGSEETCGTCGRDPTEWLGCTYSTCDIKRFAK